MVISIISLCIAALTLLYSYCNSNKQDKQNKKVLNMVDAVSRISVQSNKELYFDEHQTELIHLRPDELVGGYDRTNKYLEYYFRLLYEEYIAYRSNAISEDYWKQKLASDKKLVGNAPLVFQSYWKKKGGNYDQEFASFIHHEVLK